MVKNKMLELIEAGKNLPPYTSGYDLRHDSGLDSGDVKQAFSEYFAVPEGISIVLANWDSYKGEIPDPEKLKDTIVNNAQFDDDIGTHRRTIPCFSLERPIVTIPEPRYFLSRELFISVLCHELAHSTRMTMPERNKLAYAQEELVAEYTAFLLIESTPFSTPALLDNLKAYLAGWLKALEQAATATDFKKLESFARRAYKIIRK